MNVLFVCKFNRYRSNVALALFKKYNKNLNIEAKASGIIKGPPILEQMQRVAREFNVKLTKVPENLTEEIYNWADLVVLVGEEIPISLFDNIEGTPREAIQWKLKDVMQFDLDYHEKTKLLTKEIEENIKKLVDELKDIKS